MTGLWAPRAEDCFYYMAMPRSTRRALRTVLLACATLAAGRPVQLIPGPVRELATGKILIAQRDLPDPNFTKTVVLIVELNKEGTVGLILNRRSDVTLDSVFQTMRRSQGAAPVFFLGGPVQIDGVIGLLRADKAPGDTHHVFGDIYVTAGREPLEHMVAAGADANRFRAYLGYAGWSPGQLERETAQGSWRVLKSVAGTVFDPNPDTLWDRLINQTDGLSAGQLPTANFQLPIPKALMLGSWELEPGRRPFSAPG
jgi:putative transcriptional regulator